MLNNETYNLVSPKISTTTKYDSTYLFLSLRDKTYCIYNSLPETEIHLFTFYDKIYRVIKSPRCSIHVMIECTFYFIL